MGPTFLLILATLFGEVASWVQILSPGDLTIFNGVVNPDGFERSAILPGGIFPAPIIVAYPNDVINITVHNQLSDLSMLTGTSVHFHGMLQQTTAWADGAAFVTQCPIIPGNSFTYTTKAPSQGGTFWYHSGYGAQMCDGLKGLLVIPDSNDPQASLYDADTPDAVIAISDWYHPSTIQIQNNRPPFAYPDATLINGLGRAWTHTKSTDLAVVTLGQGSKFRMRIISLSCQPAFRFSIDNHNLTIIEVDGQAHQAYTVSSIVIYAGQRYSAVLNANQNLGNYWIRALPIIDGLGAPNTIFAGGINSAILRYGTASDDDPTTSDTSGLNPMVEWKLVPYFSPAAPGPADINSAQVHKVTLNFTLDTTKYRYALNGVDTTLPYIPVLSQILQGATASQLVPTHQYVSLPANSVIQLTIPGGGPAPDTHHPIHLHGHNFSVIRAAGQSTYNFVNPPRRDVVNMGTASDQVTIRFTTGNDGPWFMYDHNAFHMNAGFGTVLIEDTPANIKASIYPPEELQDTCNAWDAYESDGGYTTKQEY